MTEADLTAGERQRLKALDHLAVLGTPPEAEFDDIARIAGYMCNSPMAAITLVGEDMVWFKSTSGFELDCVPRTGSLADAVTTDGSTIVAADTGAVSQYTESDHVAGTDGIRSCAGTPLQLLSGDVVGALCVYDTEPRILTPNETVALETLARQIVAQLTLRDMSNRRKRENSELQAARRSIATRSSLDELTGLLSRRGIAAEIERLRATYDGPMGVLLCDLDRFKLINTSLGEETGDTVLRVVAERIRESLRSNDIIGRVGADEFVVFLPAIEPSDLAMIAERLRRRIEAPIPVYNPPLRITSSIGISIEPTADLSADRLHLNADYAMYTVKRQGGGQVCNAGVSTEAQEMRHQFECEQFVRGAIAEQNIVMHYQPLVDSLTHEPHGYEALLRWNGTAPDGLNPQTFVDIAESSGLIGNLGDQVLNQACAAAAQWQDEQPGVGVSVNVSPTQLVPAFVDTVEETLGRNKLDPQLLTVELTESSAVRDLDMAHDIVAELHRRGMRISLDDFGTGFASMAQLVDFPFHELKVDRSFCQSDEASSIAVIRASISLAQSLDAAVVAEGIETEAVRDRVVGLGVDILQGYYFARPAPLDRRGLRPERARSTVHNAA